VEHQSFFQDKLAGLSPHLPQIYSVYRLIAFEVRTFFVIFPCDSYLMVRNLWPSTRIFCFNNKGYPIGNLWFPLLRFRSALNCAYSGITDIQYGLFFVLTRARTFKNS
jgi:hypothetical protein